MCFFFFFPPQGKGRDRGRLAISLPSKTDHCWEQCTYYPRLSPLCVHFDCCIYHRAVVLYIMVIGKWMSSTGLMCIPCHTFQSFIKIKIQLSAQWTPLDAWFYLRYGNCCSQPSRRRARSESCENFVLVLLCMQKLLFGACCFCSESVYFLGDQTIAHFGISFWVVPSPHPPTPL